MFLVVGLGNPGIEYQFTPHNAGFLAIDRLAERHGAVVNNRRCRALTAKVRIDGREVILAKPDTFMNLSGMAVEALLREFEVDPQRDLPGRDLPGRELPGRDLIVLYDELDLPLGRLQIKERGSAAGHNGARSVAGALKTDEWLRIRIGVAPDLPAAAAGTVAVGARRAGREYLLSPMKKADLVVMDEVLDQAARAVETVLAKGVSVAMNEFNRREQ